MNENYSKALDEILLFIKHVEDSGIMPFREAEVYSKFLESLSDKGITLSTNELIRAWEYLESEGLLTQIKTDHGAVIFQLPLKGRDWISREIGGFTQKRQNAIADREYARNFDRTVKKNADRLSYGTWVLGIGTIGLLLWEMRHSLLALFCHCR